MWVFVVTTSSLVLAFTAYRYITHKCSAEEEGIYKFTSTYRPVKKFRMPPSAEPSVEIPLIPPSESMSEVSSEDFFTPVTPIESDYFKKHC